MADPILISRLRCPECGHEEDMEMPTNACMFFYTCTGCGVRLKPLHGDCCVFCSYGTIRCPPIQEGDCCNG